MGISIRFPDGRTETFGDDVYLITIGRDPSKCQVVFPADEVRVGREHCGLERVLARYRLVLNAQNPVFVAGERAYDGQELEPDAQIQIGKDGPTLAISVSGNVDLPETVMRVAPQPDQHAVVAKIDRRAKLNRVAALVALCLLFVLVLVGWEVYDRMRREIHHLETENLRLADLNRAQADAVERLGGTLRSMDQKVDALKPRVRESLRRAAPSVYLVVIKQADREVGVGTAWVAADGVLATNAHVAEAFDALEPGQTLHVRSNDDPPRDFKIARVELHPGFAVFNDIWTKHMPVRDAFEGMYGPLQPVGACDVALMHPEDPAGLAPPLPLADDAALRSMGAGDVVGFVGYPMEAMAVGGVNIEKPTPTTQIGHITAVTDYFLARESGGGGGHLVQHSLPMTGGASGSPMLDDAGRVVAVINAMNIIDLGLDRAPSATGVNFGQRIDLLRELLEGRADAAQAERTDAWRAQIRRFPSMHERGLALVMEDWRTQTGSASETTVHATTVRTDVDSGTGTFVGSATLELPDAGEYLFVVDSAAYDAVTLYVYDVDPLDPNATALIAADEFGYWYAAVMASAAAKGRVHVVAAGAIDGAEYSLHVYRADR